MGVWPPGVQAPPAAERDARLGLLAPWRELGLRLSLPASRTVRAVEAAPVPLLCSDRPARPASRFQTAVLSSVLFTGDPQAGLPGTGGSRSHQPRWWLTRAVGCLGPAAWKPMPTGTQSQGVVACDLVKSEAGGQAAGTRGLLMGSPAATLTKQPRAGRVPLWVLGAPRCHS